LVRAYTLPKDPRSDSQLLQGRFLSDVSKMRGQLGKWGRAALLEALGPNWGSVLFQLVKADSFSWWSDAKSTWESFAEIEQDAWREAAPYKVTYNDMGEIFYCLAYVVVKAIRHYTLAYWRTEEWGASQSSDALTWWGLNYEYALIDSTANYDSSLLVYRGTWTEVGWYLNAAQLQMESSGNVADLVEGYLFSKRIYLAVRDDPECGIGEMFVSGAKFSEWSLAPGNSSPYPFVFSDTKKRLRSFVFRGKDAAKVNFAAVTI
jgi:hypothetical protein